MLLMTNGTAGWFHRFFVRIAELLTSVKTGTEILIFAPTLILQAFPVFLTAGTMKKYAIQVGLILLALAVLAGTVYLAPQVMKVFPNASYRFVLFFLLIILASNILAKIAYKYFEI